MKKIIFVLIFLVGSSSSLSQSNKLKGALVLSPSEISAISSYSNTFAFFYSPGNIQSYINANVNNHNMVIVINQSLYDPRSGTFRNNVQDLILELLNSSYSGQFELIFLMDEIAWLTRVQCNLGKSEACHEVHTGYANTLTSMEMASVQLKSAFTSSKVWYNVAYAEIILQDGITMIHNADYYSFDCYGAWDACGDPEHGYKSQMWYGTQVFNELMRHEASQPNGRKMMLIPGAFKSTSFYNQYAILAQLEAYKSIFGASFIAGSGVFYYQGYKDMDMVVNYLHTEF